MSGVGVDATKSATDERRREEEEEEEEIRGLRTK